MSDSVQGRVVSPGVDRPLDEVDREILEFAACHQFVLFSQVVMLIGDAEDETAERLHRLEASGWLRSSGRLRHQRGAYQITAAGLLRIGSDLPPPEMDLRRYWKAIGVAWLWIGARRGMFGEVERVYTEREMRLADDRLAIHGPATAPGLSQAVRAKAAEASFGLALGGAASPSVTHYPDLVLVLPPGRIAMEFALDRPSPGSLDALLAAYADKPSVQMIVFFVVDTAIGERLRAARSARGWDEQAMRIEKAGFSLNAR